MRLGDRYRLIGIGVGSSLGYALVLGAVSTQLGAFRFLWVLPASVLLGLFTAWMCVSFFGVADLERLAAHRAHGGRHYYFESQEIQVRVDVASEVWLRFADVKACIGGDAAALRHFAEHEVSLIDGEGRAPYLSFAGVRRLMRGSRHRDARKFSLWFEREMVKPVQTRRERSLPLHETGKR